MVLPGSFLRSVAAASCLFATAAVAMAEPALPPPTSADTIAVRNYLDAHGGPPDGSTDARSRALWTVVRDFYAKRANRPAWVEQGVPTARGRQVMRAIAAASRDGLDPARYALTAPLDVTLSHGFVRLASDLGQGQVDPRGTLILWVHTPRAVDPAAALEAAASSVQPDAVLAGLRQNQPQYALLVRALDEHRAFAAAGGWGTVPGGWSLKPGGRSPHVPSLRKRLAASGDLPSALAVVPGTVLDPPLTAALRRFEKRHGLEADGMVAPEVLAALNVPVEERIAQIELNLERWRWQPLAGEREIVVNVPTFELHGYAGGAERLAMKVVTGKADSPTPIFARAMTTVVFSPYWNVPTNILQDEVLPAALRGSGYLSRQNMEVVRDGLVVPASLGNLRAPGTVIRQRPGGGNSLGLVKFVLPNPFDVYLHDTNEKGLFALGRRARSHGCVRVERPADLARFVFSGESRWSDRAIAAAMRSGREQHVALDTPIPVTIGYFTTWVDADGTVRFAPDVYRHDRSQRLLMPPS